MAEHDYSEKDSWLDSEYLDDISYYTAGVVVHSIRTKVHCQICKDILLVNPSSKSKLSVLKNRGGLIFACDDVNLFCHLTEKIIRQNKTTFFSPTFNFRIVTETLKILPPRLFDDGKHILEREPLYDHRQQLIHLVEQNYVDKRLKHESDKVNDIKSKLRCFITS